MNMHRTIREWTRFLQKTLLKEGGNVKALIKDQEGNVIPALWKGQEAQAAPIIFNNLVTRAEFVKQVKLSLIKIDELYRQEYGEGLYESNRDEILNSGYVFMGSSEFLFYPQEIIGDEEYTTFKKKTGDIDLLVPKEKSINLYHLLNKIRETRLTDKITFVGHNKFLDGNRKNFSQINGVFEYEVGIKYFFYQVDFVFVPFNEKGEPKEEEKFLRGSSWNDIKHGIKGIGHKFILQSLGSTITALKPGVAYLSTAGSTPEKIRISSRAKYYKSQNRIGDPGITSADLVVLSPFVDVKKISKSLLKNISKEELERFVNSLDQNRISLLQQIVNKEGIAQNQTVELLEAFIVYAPFVELSNLDEFFRHAKRLHFFSMDTGLISKYEKAPYRINDKDVYTYVEPDKRKIAFRKAEDIFEFLFGVKATVEDARDLASYLGTLKIIKKYLSTEKKIEVYETMIYYCYQSTNYMSIHDIQDDLIPKSVILRYYEENIPEVKQSDSFKNKEEIISLWIEKYKVRLDRKGITSFEDDSSPDQDSEEEENN